jgi:hypothetical protein
MCFAVGGMLWCIKDRLLALTRLWAIECALAALALALLFPGLFAALLTPMSDGTGLVELAWYLPGAQLSPTLAVRESLFAAVAAWCGLFGMLGLCLRAGPSVVSAARWLVQRQMWVYLLHPLFVGLAWVLLYKQPIASEVKASIAFACGVAGPLGVYAVWTIGRSLVTKL